MAAGGRHHRVASVCFEDGLLLVLLGQGGDGVPAGPVANSASGTRVHTQMGVGKIKAEKIINIPRDAESLGDVTVRLGHKAWKRLLGAPGIWEEGSGLRERRPKIGADFECAQPGAGALGGEGRGPSRVS